MCIYLINLSSVSLTNIPQVYFDSRPLTQSEESLLRNFIIGQIVVTLTNRFIKTTELMHTFYLLSPYEFVRNTLFVLLDFF